MRLDPFDGRPNCGQQVDILEIELGQAGGQQVGLFTSRQTSLDDDSPLPVNDAEASPAGQFFGRQRGVSHWDLELFRQLLERCQQSFVLHSPGWDRALVPWVSREFTRPLRL
jgi:hypothetical protein